MKLDEIPELEGYTALTDAAKALGVTRQALHKMVAADKIKTIRRVGPIPVYVLATSELNEKLAEKSRRESTPPE